MSKKKKEENKIEGVYRLASKTFGFVRTESGEEIFVPAKDSMNAMTDDKVVIKITADKTDTNKKREGKVIKIVERDSDIVVGYFEPHDGFGFVRPINKKVAFDIHIEKNILEKQLKIQ